MEHLAPIVTAIGGALLGVLGAWFSYRRKVSKLNNDNANSHLTTFYQTMNDALTAQEKRHSEGMESLRSEQREERKQWSEERQKLHDKIDSLQAESRKYVSALHEKEIEVVELRVEVKLLNDRLDQIPTSSTKITEEVTVTGKGL